MDVIFKALSDETRRSLLDMLHKRDGQTLTELEEKLGMTRFGVMKHLKVLEEASLVVTRRSGRFKYHYLNAVPIQQVIDRWIEPLIQKPMARAALDLKAKLEGPEHMYAMTVDDTKPDFVLETYINTTVEKLWAALTSGEHTKNYHFAAAEVKTDLKKGGRFDHILPDGSVMLGGEILDIDPPKRLDITFEPGWMGPDTKASRCVYEIEAEGDHCKLTVLHHALPEEQEGVRDGWARVISALKTYLETDQPTIFAANSEG
ncbi:MAG: metalloregulator ArsR/SmtB family transcription factor [Pseudomonadota bacterium]